ncbi:MAG: hypothetical protein WKF90_15845 [Pyrinomonadaceae bacterium]
MENKPLTIVTGFVGISFLLAGFYLLQQRPDNDSLKSLLHLPGAQSLPPGWQKITVPSTIEWYDTGIDVAAGKSFNIVYMSGSWTNDKNKSNSTDGLGKQGGERKTMLVPEGYLCQLVGKIGSETFVAANGYSGSSTRGGRLYLAMNDNRGTYQDNAGLLTVSVEVK